MHIWFRGFLHYCNIVFWCPDTWKSCFLYLAAVLLMFSVEPPTRTALEILHQHAQHGWKLGGRVWCLKFKLLSVLDSETASNIWDYRSLWSKFSVCFMPVRCAFFFSVYSLSSHWIYLLQNIFSINLSNVGEIQIWETALLFFFHLFLIWL